MISSITTVDDFTSFIKLEKDFHVLPIKQIQTYPAQFALIGLDNMKYKSRKQKSSLIWKRATA